MFSSCPASALRLGYSPELRERRSRLLIMSHSKPRVVIVGAGVIGLSVGVHLTDRLRNQVDVSIVADKFSQDGITSDGAGALFIPGPNYGNNSRKFLEDLRRWSTATYHWFVKLSKSSARNDAGLEDLTLLKCYNEEQEQLPWFKDLLQDFKSFSTSEIRDLKLPPRFHTVWSCKTFCLTPSVYLGWLTRKFMDNGGLQVRQKLHSLSELGSYDVIVNCTGIGAAELVGDDSMCPVAGQMVEVTGPHIVHGIYNREPDFSHMTYCFPRNGNIILGGTAQFNHSSTIPDPAVTDEIYSKCLQICPQLKGAKVVREWVCVRPGRDLVRLEMENKSPPIIHNYGHGGQGYAMSWGCAIDATDLVIKCLSGIKAASKL